MNRVKFVIESVIMMFSTSESDERNEHCLYGTASNDCNATNQFIILSSNGVLTNKSPILAPGIVSNDSASTSAEVCVEHGKVMYNAVKNNINNTTNILANASTVTANHASNYV